MSSATSRSTLSTLAARLFAWLAIVACASAQTGQPVDWRSRDLEIPYRWSGSTEGVASVVLYSSADGGRSWNQAGAGLPHVRAFRFHAPSDGEYWFAIRTYDTLGRAAPAGPLSPEMRVRVDTVGPTIGRIDAQLEGQTLRVTLDATDATRLTADGVSLYARADGRPGWLPIPVTGAEPSSNGLAIRVDGEWLAPPNAQRVEVRATLVDAAGNRSERSTAAVAGVAAAGLGQRPGAAPIVNTFVTPPTPGRTAGFGGGVVDPFAAAERRAAQSGFAPPPISGSAVRPSPQVDSAFASTARLPPAAKSDSLAPRRPRRRSAPESTSTPWPVEPPKTRSFAEARPSRPFGSASFRGTPSVRLREAPPAPLGTPRRIVNGAEFEFDYELEETGRWGVGKVELWGTDNGGRSWSRFAIDSDRQSPIHVRTAGEGTYGFRLVVEPVGGLDASTPKPGDPPEAIVVVDTQKPRAAIKGVRQGEGYFADQLIIEWRVGDEHLADRPIDLFYSNRPTGPWVPVATNLPNSGRHSWRLQRHLPRRPYLRLEARDEAGNVARVTTPDAVVIDMPNAGGSLRGVRASGR